MVVLATAHPAKFPEPSSAPPAARPSSPSACGSELGQHERCAVLPNDYAAVADFITSHARLQGSTHKSRGRRAGVGA